MRKLISLPTWLLCKLARPWFREDHPWKQRPKFFSLEDWHLGQTRLCREFDYVFWIFIVTLPIIIAALVRDLT